MRLKRPPFLPAGAVTGIGSLPFRSPVGALRLIAGAAPTVPFWPQLPALSERENIIGQGLGVLAERIATRREGYGYQVLDAQIDAVVEALHRGSGELTPDYAVGFGAFEEALGDGMFPSAIAVKGQIEGPITLSSCLYYKGKPFLADASLYAAVAFHVSQIVCWQIERLQTAGLPVLLFVDEPCLCLDGLDSKRLTALAAVLESARVRGAYAGLHCCAARPFARMCAVGPDILSFDAHEGLELFFSDPDAKSFQGIVAYGLIPTCRDLGEFAAQQIFTRWLTAASLAGDPVEFAARSMVTATCGLGLLPVKSVIESFALAREVGDLFRALQPTLSNAGAGS